MNPNDIRRAMAGRGLAWGAGLFLAYGLSVGPATGMAERGWIPEAFVARVYRPLRLVLGSPLERPLQIYISWWLPPPPQVDIPLAR